MKSELVEARKNIAEQLRQLEGSAMDSCSRGGPPDYRGVYAELQEELREIDTLLEADGDRRDVEEGKSAYEPMIRLKPDGSVGIPNGPNPGAMIFAAVTIGLILVWIGVDIFRH